MSHSCSMRGMMLGWWFWCILLATAPESVSCGGVFNSVNETADEEERPLFVVQFVEGVDVYAKQNEWNRINTSHRHDHNVTIRSVFTALFPGLLVQGPWNTTAQAKAWAASDAEIQRIVMDEAIDSPPTPPLSFRQNQGPPPHPRRRQLQEDGAIPWGKDRLDQERLPLDGIFDVNATGLGVTVYLMEPTTGLRATHAEFQNRPNRIRCARDDETTCLAETMTDGQGTAVASVIGGTTLGVAPDVDLVFVSILNNAGRASVLLIWAGLETIVQQARDSDRPVVAYLGWNTSILRLGIDFVFDASVFRNVVVVVAAGDDNVNNFFRNPSPALGVLGVGASDRDDTKAAFSNFGIFVNLFAPGVDISAAGKNSDDEVVVASGTALAAAHVCGVVALLVQAYPDESVLPIRRRVLASATRRVLRGLPLGTPNRLVHVDRDVLAAN